MRWTVFKNRAKRNDTPAIVVHATPSLGIVHGELHDSEIRVHRHKIVYALVNVCAGRCSQCTVGKRVILMRECFPDPLKETLPVGQIRALRTNTSCNHSHSPSNLSHTHAAPQHQSVRPGTSIHRNQASIIYPSRRDRVISATIHETPACFTINNSTNRACIHTGVSTCDAAPHSSHIDRFAAHQLLQHSLQPLWVAPIAHCSPQALLWECQLSGKQFLQDVSLVWHLQQGNHVIIT